MTLPFKDVVIDSTSGQPKLFKRDYEDFGALPVIDQGQDLVAGFTSDKEMSYQGKLPAVVFGDHTRALKYIDFPFVMGADGVKVLVPNGDIEAKFLYYFFLSKPIDSRGYSRHFKFLKELIIPIPPIAEQRRIVEILDQADLLRKKRAEANAKADRILPALFIKMFGDPATNSKNLNVVEFGSLIAEGPQNGLYKHVSFYGEGTPILRIDSFYEGVMNTSKELRRLKLTDDEIEKYALKENDIVINRVNGSKELFGKSALVPKLSENTVFESNMMRFSVDTTKLNPVFIIQQLQTPAIRQQMIGRSKHINQYSVNQGDIRSLRVLWPSLSSQNLFAKQTISLQSHTQRQYQSQAILETLFQNLLHRAFSGNLTAEWRKAHMAELLQEMEHQAKALGLERAVEYEQLGMLE